MNVVIWARVSSREQREGYSLDAQLRACRAKAEKHGWQVVKEFVVAESAKRGAEREAFNTMFRWVKRNARKLDIRAILSHKLDRACRNMRDAVRLQGLEDECGTGLAFVENDFGPGAAGALSFNVMAAVSQYYSDNLRTEVLKGMDERVRQGWPPGRAPFGYLNVDNKNEPVIPHPEKAATLHRMFELYATGDYTFASLAAKLREEGHTYQPSRPCFTRPGMSHMLNNRFYIGELERNGKIYRGAYRLVIDPDLFEACQDVLQGRNRRTGSPRMKYSGGLFQCACCGHAITGERIRRKLIDGTVRNHYYYRCANNDPPADHPVVRWREEDVEAAIIAELQSIRIPDDEVRAWLRKTIQAALEDATGLAVGQRQAHTKRLQELDRMKRRLLDAYLAETIDQATLQQRQNEIDREIVETQRRLDEVEELPPGHVEQALVLFDMSQNLVESWQRSKMEGKREILGIVSLNRMMSDVTIELTKRKPFDVLAKTAKKKDGRGGEI